MVATTTTTRSLPATISNGDDLSPFIRRAFAQSKPEALLHNLRLFARSKYFIRSVDDLHSLLFEAETLKSSISDSNSTSTMLLSAKQKDIQARSIL
ncbi:uncharacterized protein A4U43_C04F31020 [Asparagus officinalis]|uniref:Uncharacterized protein n=1 Tax=Asparagus officinalis TaxID=4686 RepID=A0A5P1F6M2_ASPOF|nr:uncharacterized protein A4U43_C04F31020 [Asparagus officinalis]